MRGESEGGLNHDIAFTIHDELGPSASLGPYSRRAIVESEAGQNLDIAITIHDEPGVPETLKI